MIYIAHRGNINGPNHTQENSIPYLEEAMQKGFNVELDLWGQLGELWLGHDFPVYPLPPTFLEDHSNQLWVHCKNAEALMLVGRNSFYSGVRYFFHNSDAYTLTSNQMIWCYPTSSPPDWRSIVVLPELQMEVPQIAGYLATLPVIGVCSDYVEQIKKV